MESGLDRQRRGRRRLNINSCWYNTGKIDSRIVCTCGAASIPAGASRDERAILLSARLDRRREGRCPRRPARFPVDIAWRANPRKAARPTPRLPQGCASEQLLAQMSTAHASELGARLTKLRVSATPKAVEQAHPPAHSRRCAGENVGVPMQPAFVGAGRQIKKASKCVSFKK